MLKTCRTGKSLLFLFNAPEGLIKAVLSGFIKIKWHSIFFLLLCLRVFPSVANSPAAENPVTDSLVLALKNTHSHSEKTSTLYELSKAFYNSSELTKALETSNTLLEQISKQGTKTDSAKCFRITGLIYLKMAWYDKSLENFMKAQQLFHDSGDTIMQARALMNIGIVHDYLGNKPMSLAYYNKALEHFKSKNDEGGMADCELNIAILLTKQKEYEKACETLIMAISIYEKTGNKPNLAAAYTNLGLTYKKMGNYPLAIDYLNRANVIWGPMGDEYYICNYHLNMGEIMLDMKNPGQAKIHLTKAESLARKYEFKEMEALAYEYLSDYNAAIKDYLAAYTYLNKSKQLNDSILNAETTEKVNQIQYHYEIAKREADNEKLVKQNLSKELQLSKQNLFLYILSVILVFIAVLAIFLVNQNRAKRKANMLLANQNEQIEAQKNELVKLNASKDKFLSILAHDIRNPLSSIFGLSDILVNDYNTLTEDEKLVFTRDIHTLSENLFEIINTLLAWSTSQSGMIAYRPKPFLITELCRKSIQNLQTVAKQKDIKLISSGDDSLEVHADENMIFSVLNNLISNAIKFSYSGSKIRVETTQTDGFASISVIDTGMGLNAENKNKIFRYDHHFLSKGTAGESGTGLGLILCKDFVEKNGGTIRVESEKNLGSTFTFTIPVNNQLTSTPQSENRISAEIPQA
jgi:signal transduction histidine kinase